MSGGYCRDPGCCRSQWRMPLRRSVSYRFVAVALCVLACGCASLRQNGLDGALKPSNDRNWKANMAVLPYARFRGEHVEVHNVRNCRYMDEETYDVNYDDRDYDLNQLETLDLVVCPFKQHPSLAHTMLSFGFQEGRYLVVSVEVRLEEGESYSTVGGMMRQFELMYVVADERDAIELRTEVRDTDVYVYRCRLAPEVVRALFVDVMKRINRLKSHPEFYDTLLNNCTTNLVAHFNRVEPGILPWDAGSVVSGYSDVVAYSLGLLVDYGSFEETRRRAYVNDRAHRVAGGPDFSRKIRGQSGMTRLVDGPAPRWRR